MAAHRRGSRSGGPLRAVVAVSALACAVAGAALVASGDEAVPLSVVPEVAAAEREAPRQRDATLERRPVEPESRPEPPAPPQRAPLGSRGRVAEVLKWVEDLRDDDVPWNATEAWARLCNAEDAVDPFLRPALRSADVQQRQYAAQILVRRGAPAWPELVDGAVELLRSDSILNPWTVHDRDSAVAWLEPRVKPASYALRNALYSDDSLQRFLSAFVLARTATPIDRHVVFGLLLERLGDNDIRSDATMAVHGLYRLGPAVLGPVRTAMRDADPQALSLLRLVELDLMQPPRGVADIVQRKRMHSVTALYHDPAVEYELGRPVLPPR